jgi:hypothetical protein
MIYIPGVEYRKVEVKGGEGSIERHHKDMVM